MEEKIPFYIFHFMKLFLPPFIFDSGKSRFFFLYLNLFIFRIDDMKKLEYDMHNQFFVNLESTFSELSQR